MKARIRRLLVASIAVLLSVGAGLLARGFWERRADLGARAVDLLPRVAQRIKNFHRVKVEDGQKVWEVAAREARYFDDEGVIVVKEPVVSMFLGDGDVVELRGREGKVYLDGQEIERVDVSGAIDVRLSGYALHAEFARYETGRDMIVVPGRVKISGSGFDIDGTRMELEVDTQRLRLSRDVETMLWPRT